jgi:hypothetical protein
MAFLPKLSLPLSIFFLDRLFQYICTVLQQFPSAGTSQNLPEVRTGLLTRRIRKFHSWLTLTWAILCRAGAATLRSAICQTLYPAFRRVDASFAEVYSETSGG